MPYSVFACFQAAEKKFDLEFEFGLATPDCVERDPIVLTNGQFPGPTLTVNVGDLVTVNVRNRLHSVAVNVHFHGVHQRGTPWSDGATYYNSCPVSPVQLYVLCLYVVDC